MSIWVPSPNMYVGRKAPLKWIVWHSTESSEVLGGAYNVGAGWFGKASSQVSAHIVADNGADARYSDGIVECVKPQNTAWHCANGNASGYGVEIIGYAKQGAADWTDPYSQKAIQNAAFWLRTNPATRVIPAVWLTDAELKAGKLGHVTHAQIARVLGGTNHTDPGLQFPFNYTLQMLGATTAPTPVPEGMSLVYGMMGHPGVREAQAWFRRMFPSYAGDLPATGNYLDQTVAVVKEFQARAGVTGPDANGRIIGPRTFAAMSRYGWK